MKKNLFLLFLFCFSPALASGNKSGDDQQKILLSYMGLNAREVLTVHSYDAYHVHITFTKPDPFLNVSFVSAQGQGLKSVGSQKITSLLTVLSTGGKGDFASVTEEIQKVLGNKPVTAVSVRSGGALLQFDLIGKDRKKIISEWFDPNSGFDVKQEVFDSNGLVLSLDYYADLQINPKHIPEIPLKLSRKVLSQRGFEGLPIKNGFFKDGQDFNGFLEDFVARNCPKFN